MIKSVEEIFSVEIFNEFDRDLKVLEEKISTYPLEVEEYHRTLGQIAALRECKEKMKDLLSKFFPR
jgi:hypothetical protein